MRRSALVDDFLCTVRANAPDQKEFHQAVEHVARDVITVEKAHSAFAAAKILERLSEPDRILGFRVVWQNDKNEVEVNRGWRVQYSNAIGPYKGGLRFHPSVSPSVLKFLGFEQVFKNALTGLPLGGGKGGADFDPRGRSDAEIMRFCQAFMHQLAPFIGPDRDIPAGDINVGTREIGWLFGAYKAHAQKFDGALTGKGQSFGGSAIRAEATGYGLVYFVEAMLAEAGNEIEGKRIAISGKGNVATHAAEKAMERGAKVITLSDTSGTLYTEDGLTRDTIEWVRARKQAGEDISSPPSESSAIFKPDMSPWEADVDIALPCATQNELDKEMAEALVETGVSIIAEGANMPLTSAAHEVIENSGVLHAPGKASNAGGVAVSGLEMSQNSYRRYASSDEVDAELKQIMRDIHARVLSEGRDGNRIDYSRGANIAGFRRVADAISAMGAI